MKNILLAGVAVLCVSSAAHAEGLLVQSPTADIMSQLGLTNQGTELLRWGDQLQAMGQDLAKMDRAYEQATTFASTFNHMPNISGAESLLGLPQIANPLTSDPMSATSLIAGTQRLGATFGSGGAFATTNFNTNHVYTSTDGSYNAQLEQQNASSIANTQALTQTLYQSMAQRAPLVQSLEQQLAVATDPKDVMDLTARLQAEQVLTSTQMAQAQHLRSLYTLQQDSLAQQRKEMLNQQIDHAIASSNAATAGGDIFAASGTSAEQVGSSSSAANQAAASMSAAP